MRYVLALDQGTTSSRAIVFNEQGVPVAGAAREYPQYYPQPGWVEHDAEEIWASQLAVAREALQRANLSAGDVAAIGVTNQRETSVVWDRATGEPLARAIVWQCRRTAARCAELRAAGLSERCARAPAWCWTPISRPPSWSGCWTMCRACAHGPSAARWPSARLIVPAMAAQRRTRCT